MERLPKEAFEIECDCDPAPPHSSTLPEVGERRRVGPIRRSAEYNSAIQQIANLRYDGIHAAR